MDLVLAKLPTTFLGVQAELEPRLLLLCSCCTSWHLEVRWRNFYHSITPKDFLASQGTCICRTRLTASVSEYPFALMAAGIFKVVAGLLEHAKKKLVAVGQNSNRHTMTDKERYHTRNKLPQRNQQRTIGVARLATDMWQPGARNQRIARQ